MARLTMKNNGKSNITRGRLLLCILVSILVTHMIDRELLSSELLNQLNNCVEFENTRTADEASNQAFLPSGLEGGSKPELPSDKNATPGSMPSSDGGLFYCGYNQLPFGRTVFPEYAARYEGGYDIVSHKGIGSRHPMRDPQPNDILIFGMHGKCTTPLPKFPGKILVMNGEPKGGDITKRIYQIGAVADDPSTHTLNAYHFAWSPFLRNYLQGETEILRKLWDHSHKPINTGKHNGIFYANLQCHPHRENAVNAISKIMPVHVGGKCQGAGPHTGQFVKAPSPGKWMRNYEVQKDYKFCFAMENRHPYQPNYITEKILNPFLAGCIPIYYGTPQVFEVFNPKAFVYYDPSNPGPALQQISELYYNEGAYQEMLYNQPILAHGNETLRKYFSLFDEIEGGYLKHKIRAMLGVS